MAVPIHMHGNIPRYIHVPYHFDILKQANTAHSSQNHLAFSVRNDPTLIMLHHYLLYADFALQPTHHPHTHTVQASDFASFTVLLSSTKLLSEYSSLNNYG